MLELLKVIEVIISILIFIIFFSVIVGPLFDYLDSPVIRVTGADVPMPYTKELEKHAIPQPEDVFLAVKKLFEH